MPNYANITNAKNEPFTGNIRRYYTVDGYTIRAGVPIDWMVQVDNRSTWYRVRCICFSNSGSLIVKVKGQTLFVREDQNELRIIERGVVDPHAVREIELFIMNTSWTYFGLFHKIDDCLELARVADSAYTWVECYGRSAEEWLKNRNFSANTLCINDRKYLATVFADLKKEYVS